MMTFHYLSAIHFASSRMLGISFFTTAWSIISSNPASAWHIIINITESFDQNKAGRMKVKMDESIA
jgi:hypothetical protein